MAEVKINVDMQGEIHCHFRNGTKKEYFVIHVQISKLMARWIKVISTHGTLKPNKYKRLGQN